MPKNKKLKKDQLRRVLFRFNRCMQLSSFGGQGIHSPVYQLHHLYIPRALNIQFCVRRQIHVE
jgi:hypothetical protein